MTYTAQQEAMMLHHLCYNHFPPVRSEFVDTAFEAINLAERGEWDTILLMPNGVELSVEGIVDGLHLSEMVRVDTGELHD